MVERVRYQVTYIGAGGGKALPGLGRFERGAAREVPEELISNFVGSSAFEVEILTETAVEAESPTIPEGAE